MQQQMSIPLPCFLSEDKGIYRVSPYQYHVTSPVEQWTVRYGKADVPEIAIDCGNDGWPNQTADTTKQLRIILQG